MTRKLGKFKRKFKHKKEDTSTIVSVKSDQPPAEGTKAQDESHLLDQSAKRVNRKKKSAKQVHVAFLPERYQPLVEDDIADQPRDDKSKKKTDKYKKFRKNAGKALRYSWKCLVVGLQNLSTAYSMPLGVSGAVVPEIHRAKAHVQCVSR